MPGSHDSVYEYVSKLTALACLKQHSSSAGGRCKQTVVKQQTLPAVSSRHLWFHRLLSGRNPPQAPSSTPPREDFADQTRREHCHGDQQQQHRRQRQTVTAAVVPMQGLRDLAVQTGFVQPLGSQQGGGMSTHRIDGVATMPSVGEKSKNVPNSGGPLNNNHDALVTSVAAAPAGAAAAHSYGQLYIGLSYERDTEVTSGFGECSGTLIVNVMRIEGLPAREFSGSSDPYVKVRLRIVRGYCERQLHCLIRSCCCADSNGECTDPQVVFSYVV